METFLADHVQQNLSHLVEKINKKHEIFRIKHSNASAILLEEEDYEGLLETLTLLSLPNFRERLAISVQQAKQQEVYTNDYNIQFFA